MIILEILKAIMAIAAGLLILLIMWETERQNEATKARWAEMEEMPRTGNGTWDGIEREGRNSE